MTRLTITLALTTVLGAGVGPLSQSAMAEEAGGEEASVQEGSPYDRPGYATRVEDGRLWVFLAGSKEWKEFLEHGEPAKSVTLIAAGPDGMTIRSSDRDTIDGYLAHKSGFYTQVVDGRLWVFEEGSDDLKAFLEHGEPAKSVTRIGAGPNGMTIRSADAQTIDAYLAK